MKIIVTEKQLELLKEEIVRHVPGSESATWIAKGISDLMNNKLVLNRRDKFLKRYFNSIKDKDTLKYTIEILKNTFNKDFYGIINNLNFSPKDKKYINDRIGSIQLGKSLDASKTDKVKVSSLKMKDPSKMKASFSLYKFLKNEEGLKGQPVLVAYQKKGDVPTIGYGHTTNVKLGQKINNRQAEKFLKEDIETAERCVKNIFAEWRNKGSIINLTQSMFDALVSLVFNSGCGSLRGTDKPNELIDSIKNKKFHEVPSKIKKFSLKSGFGGISNRRERESALFCKEGGCGSTTTTGIS